MTFYLPARDRIQSRKLETNYIPIIWQYVDKLGNQIVIGY